MTDEFLSKELRDSLARMGTKEYAIECLKETLHVGDTVWSIPVSMCTRAGNLPTRFFVFRGNEPYDLTAKICKTVGIRRNQTLDAMSHDTTNEIGHLSWVLFNDDGALKHRTFGY